MRMRKKQKKMGILIMAGMLTFGTAMPINNPYVTYAHSGRTDASGGHKDNKNKSGLGSYHYHCGGYPAHLHDGGICPYSSTGTSSSQTPAKTNATKPEKIQIKSAPTELKVGENQGFTYSVENGTSTDIKVESSNTDVVMINEDHTLKAVGIGEASIKISSANATETFTVIVKPIDVESIATEEEHIRLKIDETTEISANVIPSNATDKALKWSTTDKNIVEVNDGNLLPQKEGTATIIIEASNGVKKEVTVEVYCIEVDSVEIDTSNMEYSQSHVVDIESTIDLKAIVSPTDATYPDITWSSSNEDVVKITDNGFEITGTGKVIIKATAHNGVSDEIELEVVDKSLSSGAALGIIAILAASGGIIFKRRKKKLQNIL